ncbi:MAG: nuclease-related domain-containing protein [Acutalibacteraceae bacterium]
MEIFAIFPIIIVVGIIVAIVLLSKAGFTIESGKRRAGRRGEVIVSNAIRSILSDEDILLTNIEISFKGKTAELDNVIINKYGVFIIEVKNYKGRIYGEEDDYEWEKYKDDGYGNVFKKNVKNPIRQVKRQIYILAKYLDYNGEKVWINGYALLFNGNSPIQSKYILSSVKDIEQVIHTTGKNELTKKQVENIAKILQ